jgi:hypothetical protein
VVVLLVAFTAGTVVLVFHEQAEQSRVEAQRQDVADQLAGSSARQREMRGALRRLAALMEPYQREAERRFPTLPPDEALEAFGRTYSTGQFMSQIMSSGEGGRYVPERDQEAFGDLDQDGDDDRVVVKQYAAQGGNGWYQEYEASLAEGGDHVVIQTGLIGGKGWGLVDDLFVREGAVYFHMLRNGDDDAMNFPTTPGLITCEFDGELSCSEWTWLWRDRE